MTSLQARCAAITLTATALPCAFYAGILQQAVGGTENVVAIVPKGAKLDTVTESTDTVILKAADAAAALELRKRLTASANQMSAVAGLLDVSLSLCLITCWDIASAASGPAATTYRSMSSTSSAQGGFTRAHIPDHTMCACMGIMCVIPRVCCLALCCAVG
jgi:hypothetical protein